jgi:site-specific recombinase XerD
MCLLWSALHKKHTFATRGLECGINPKVMQEILGHTSLAITMDLYSHVLPGIKKDSINKLKKLYELQNKNGLV